MARLQGLPKNPLEAFPRAVTLERITKERRGRHSRTFLLCLRARRLKPYSHSISAPRVGALVLAHLQSGILTVKEVHRFPKEPVDTSGSSLGRPATRLEVRRCPCPAGRSRTGGIGVDAWGVDYALLVNMAICWTIRIITATGATERRGWRKSLGKIGREDI